MRPEVADTQAPRQLIPNCRREQRLFKQYLGSRARRLKDSDAVVRGIAASSSLSFAALDTLGCGGGAVGADFLAEGVEMGNPFGVVAGFIFGAVFTLPQRQGFRFERVINFRPIFPC